MLQQEEIQTQKQSIITTVQTLKSKKRHETVQLLENELILCCPVGGLSYTKGSNFHKIHSKMMTALSIINCMY